jgi:hypothetical protein
MVSLAVVVPRSVGAPIAAIGLRGRADVLVPEQRLLVEMLHAEAARLGEEVGAR